MTPPPAPAAGPLSPAEADAWLEASHADPLPADWAARVTADGSAPDEATWVALLAAEAELVRDGPSPALEARLTALAAGPDGSRVTARAVAARVRAGIAAGRGDADPLDGPAGRTLLAWEREYLRGLAAWSRGEDGTAALEAALRHDPHRTCVRLALAVAVAPRSADAALELLTHPAPTREVLITRAALLARLGRLDDAADALAALDGSPPPGREASRSSWAAAREEYHLQEQLLRAALAERAGAWPAAGRAWAASGVPARHPAVGRARAAFAAGREAESLTPGQGFRRDAVRRRVEQESRALGDGPHVGDALFFRAAARVAADPERAAADLETLLRQPAWVAAERAAGGGRLVVVGDLLLRLGRATAAAGAYAAVGAAERLAVARAGDGPWAELVAAAAALARGEPATADLHLSAAEQSGAVAATLAALRAVRAGAADDLPAAGFPDVVAAAVRLTVAARAEDIEAFVRAAGPDWPAACPIDPEWAARTLLAAWCAAGRRAEAREFADGLVRRGVAWAGPLATLVRVGEALDAALAGRLAEAVRALDPDGGGT